jgi:sec-independent protein translocase protein TatB
MQGQYFTSSRRYLWAANRGRYHELFMHFGDSIFIFLLALVLFGPKKLPEIGRTIGKLLAEFRRASNEFKFQIQEELRNMEDEERRKKLAEKQALEKAAEALPAGDASTPTAAPTILPPSSGSQVSAGSPYATPVQTAEAAPDSAVVTPSAAEVIVDSPAPSAISPVPEVGLATETSAPVDLTASANGAHPAETVEPALPSESVNESVHHG